MKKTRKTMFTAALLSAACALSTGLKANESLKADGASDQGNDETAFSADRLSAAVAETPSPQAMYAPPQAKGDMDHNYDLNIADLIIMKDSTIDFQSGNVNESVVWSGDLNGDYGLDGYDILMMQRYLMGDTENPGEPLPPGSHLPVYKEPESIATVYGPYPAYWDKK